MAKQYGEFLRELRSNVSDAKVDLQDQQVLGYIEGCMRAVRIALTCHSPALRDLPEGIPLTEDLMIDRTIATDALSRIDDDLRAERAGCNMPRILDEREQLTYDELLNAFGMFPNDRDALYEYVHRRDYMRNISASSPLYPLIHCILQKRGNFHEVLEQELADHQLALTEPEHPEGADAVIGIFKELLGECATSSVD